MPQITNRKLVGEMGATPTGQGTVYTAMLKACSTNRERAARVNDSEQQRLRKAARVLDKHSRHNQWAFNQEMERVRQSLNRLDAYQRVLREDYPVKNLIGKSSPSRVNYPIIKRKTARSLLRSRMEKSGSKTNQTDGGTVSENDNISTNPPDDEECREDQVKQTNNKLTQPEISLCRDNSTEFNMKNKSTIKFESDDLVTKKIVNDLTERQSSHDAIDIVTSANTTTVRQNETNGGENGPSQIRSNKDMLSVGDTVNSIIMTNPFKTPNQDIEYIDQATTKNKNDTKRTRIPNKWIQESRIDAVPSYDENVSDSDSKMPSSHAPAADILAELEGVVKQPLQQHKRREHINRLQTKWRAMMEARLCNRGFDMNTLRVDIDRKQRRMDIDRQFREIKIRMLQDSMTINERIIRTSKETFDSVIMETSPK